jgi:hypothetical protein
MKLVDLLDALGVTKPWRRQAKCGSRRAYEWLDPITGSQPTATEWERAERGAWTFCARCPVIQECAAEADVFMDEGVRGGSLRIKQTGPPREYVVLPLIPGAVPSKHDAPSTLVS